MVPTFWDEAMMEVQGDRRPLKTLDCWLDKPFPAAMVQGQLVKIFDGTSCFSAFYCIVEIKDLLPHCSFLCYNEENTESEANP